MILEKYMIPDNSGTTDDCWKVCDLNTRDKFLSLELGFIVGGQVQADVGAHPQVHLW